MRPGLHKSQSVVILILASCRGVIFTHQASDTSLPETGIVPPDQVLALEEGDSRPSLATGDQRSMQSFGD